MKNIKKLLILTVCLVAVLAAGCSKKEENTTAQDSSDAVTQGEIVEEQPTATPEPVEVIENGAIGVKETESSVKITMPAAAFGDNVEEEAAKTKEIRGFSEAVVNEDGSVTFTMTKEQQIQWVEETAESSIEYANQLLTNFKSLQSVEFGDDYTTATIKADGAKYDSDTEKVAAEGVANFLFNCQTLNGVPLENLKVTVTFVNAETGEQLEVVEVLGNA